MTTKENLINNIHPFSYNFDGPLIGKYFPKGEQDELGRTITSVTGWVDGGDCTQRVGMYYGGLEVYAKLFGQAKMIEWLKSNQLPSAQRSAFLTSLKFLQCKEDAGVYKRHPDTNFWYSDCDRMSRDQAYPMVAAVGLMDFKFNLWSFFKSHCKRALLFMTNTRRNGATKANHGQVYNNRGDKRNYNWKLPDLTGFSFWALYIRGFKLWWAYPVLCVLDLEFLLNSVLISYNDNDNDVVNHCVELAYSHVRYPTPLSWISNKFINSAKRLNNKNKIYFAMAGEPYFIQYLYEPILEKVCKK